MKNKRIKNMFFLSTYTPLNVTSELNKRVPSILIQKCQVKSLALLSFEQAQHILRHLPQTPASQQKDAEPNQENLREYCDQGSTSTIKSLVIGPELSSTRFKRILFLYRSLFDSLASLQLSLQVSLREEEILLSVFG